MPIFKDYLNDDLDVFVDTDEFAEMHNIDGIDMPIVIDNDLIKVRQQDQIQLNDPDGFYKADVLFHVKKADFGEKPAVSQIMKLDGKLYRVSEAEENGQIYSVTLAANES